MTTELRLRLKVLVLVVFLLTLAQIFSAGLSISSLERLYLDSLISSYRATGQDFQRNLNNALRFGKDLKKFIGIQKQLEEVKKNNPDLDNVTVSLPDGVIIHSLNPHVLGKKLPAPAIIDFKSPSRSSSFLYTRTQGKYYISFPVHNWKGRWAGTVNLSFREDLVNARVQRLLISSFKQLGLITAVTVLALVIGLLFLVEIRAGKSRNIKLFLMLIGIMGGAQILYSFYNIQVFRKNYIQMTRAKTETVTRQIQNQIELLLGKGIRIDRLIKVDALMNEIISATPEIQTMRILDKHFKPLYLAGEKTPGTTGGGGSSKPSGNGNIFRMVMPLNKTSGPNTLLSLPGLSRRPPKAAPTLEGYIEVNLSPSVIQTKIRHVILDSGTVVVVSFLFLAELIVFFFVVIGRQSIPAAPPAPGVGAVTGMVRPAAFLFLFAASLSNSFIPLVMRSLLGHGAFFGLSVDMAIGLPLSVEMFCIALVLFPGGNWMDRRGWHEPFFLGVILTALGAFLSGTASSPLGFILFRAVVGLGYGLTWMSLQGFVVMNTTSEARARGMSDLLAGMFAGLICGSSVGAMIAERIGYASVFKAASVIVLLALGFVLVFMRPYLVQPASWKPEKKARLGLSGLAGLFTDRRVFALFIFCLIPNSLVLVGILFYLCPVYLNRIGTPQSDIGRALMVFGLCMIYIAPAVSRLIDRRANHKFFVVVAGLLSGLGLCLFVAWGGLPGIVLMIFILGVANSFGDVAQTLFVLDLQISKRLGQGRVMAIQRAVDKLGQMLGPIVIGGAISAAGIQKGIGFIGMAYIAATAFFVLMTRAKPLPDANQHD